MKIAMIVGRFPVLSETFILNQIIGLISRGHQVDIYACESMDTYKMHPDVEKYQLLACTHYQPQIPLNHFWRILKALGLLLRNFHKSPLVLWRSLNFFKYGRTAASLRLFYSVIPFLDAQPYDIIHCQFGVFGIDGMILRNIGAVKGKLITCFRGYDISWFIKQQGEQIYNPLFASGDFFLANCEFFRHRAIKLSCDERKIIVHGSGIDCRKFPFKTRKLHPDSKIKILTIGRLVEKKGIEYGIRAVAKLAKTQPNIEYQIIGDGQLKQDLEQLILSLHVADKIKLIGWKNQPEIIEILDKSHIFIAVSVTCDDGNQDAPVNTLKEAMAMGLPVIGSLHGGIPELIQDGVSGFLVPERDVDAITDKLNYLIQHPEIWPQMGQAGRAYVEKHYNLNKLNDKLVQIYRQVLINDFPEFAEELPDKITNSQYT